MAITNRNLEPGTRLVAKYKGKRYEAVVVEGGLIELTDAGRPDGSRSRFKSPSAAGSAIMGGIACNGWRFWSIEGEAPAETARPPATAANTAKTKAKRLIHRTPNQKGIPEGETRYFCDACMKGFTAPAGEVPEVCPEGHRADDPELTVA